MQKQLELVVSLSRKHDSAEIASRTLIIVSRFCKYLAVAVVTVALFNILVIKAWWCVLVHV